MSLFNAAATSSSSVSSAPVEEVSTVPQAVLAALDKYRFVMKLELNANPDKVNAKKASGKYQQKGVITHLGGCATLSQRGTDETGESAFIKLSPVPHNADGSLQANFLLPIFHCVKKQVEEDAATKAILTLKPEMAAFFHQEVTVEENFVQPEKLKKILEKISNLRVQWHFENLNISQTVLDEMADTKGLLVIYFALDFSNAIISTKQIQDPTTGKMIRVPVDEEEAALNPKRKFVPLHVQFYPGQRAKNMRQMQMLPASRIQTVLDILNAPEEEEEVDLVELRLQQEAFAYEKYLNGVGFGNKAHKSSKKLLLDACAEGRWEPEAEKTLYAIALRGQNSAYTMKNHVNFMKDCKKILSDLGLNPEELIETLVTEVLVDTIKEEVKSEANPEIAKAEMTESEPVDETEPTLITQTYTLQELDDFMNDF
jgi:hypothetical protein